MTTEYTVSVWAEYNTGERDTSRYTVWADSEIEAQDGALVQHHAQYSRAINGGRILSVRVEYAPTACETIPATGVQAGFTFWSVGTQYVVTESATTGAVCLLDKNAGHVETDRAAVLAFLKDRNVMLKGSSL